METVWPGSDGTQALFGEYLHIVKGNQYPQKESRRNNHNPFGLSVIKLPADGKIIERGVKDPHSHSNRFRSFFFATSQSNTFSLPSETRFSVAASSFACQAGDLNSSSERLNSSQRV